jgi:hypothetical protein
MREIRSSGSAEGVMGNCDPYSDSPEPLVVDKPQSTRVRGADVVMVQQG